MSLHRENVSWQRADGSWAVGFFDYTYVRTDSPDFDSEWDVQYFTRFSNVYYGATPEEAMRKYTERNANPGGTILVYNTPENQDAIKQYEEECAKVEAYFAKNPVLWR